MAQPGVTHEGAAAILPPQNLDAEENVLGALMLARSAIDNVQETGLQPNDFYRNISHGRIYHACIELHRQGEPVDAITVGDWLEKTGHLADVGGREKIQELASIVPAAANAAHYARIVRQLADARALIDAGQRIAALGHNRPGDTDELAEQARAILDRAIDRTTIRDRLHPETWAEFEKASHDRIPVLVDGLWPEAALGFIAAPPKKGKTWIGLSLALSVATGKPFLGRFDIPTAQPVVYAALEGHRAAIRTRIGALAHGLGVNPDPGSGHLDRLHLLYKPRGLNLADPAWIRDIRRTIDTTGARLLIVDVLRAAAAIKENDNDAFNAFRLILDPIVQDGCSIALLHHFGKLTEITKDRTPGERMSGAGAMYGAFDVGVFITGADKEARELRLEFELRDFATPEPVGVKLTGDGTGDNGGFVYRDTAAWTTVDTTPNEDDLKAPAREIYEWICEQGGEADSASIRLAFEISLTTLADRDTRLEQLGVEIIQRPGKAKIYRIPTPAEHVQETLDVASGPVDNSAPDPQSGPSKCTPTALWGSATLRVDPDNHAGLPDTPTDPQSKAASRVELAQTNGFHTLKPPHIPYGDAAALDAAQHPEDDDILFTEAETADLTARLAAAKPDPDPDDDGWLT